MRRRRPRPPPLSVWFWAAYLVVSQTPGMSAVQFQRQLGLTRYETAFGILNKLRAGMVRPDQDRIGGRPKEHVEVDETWVGGRTRGEGRGIHHKTLVAAARAPPDVLKRRLPQNVLMPEGGDDGGSRRPRRHRPGQRPA